MAFDLRAAPVYVYRIADLPERLQIGTDGVRRGLKAAYNAHIPVMSAAGAIRAALRWARREGLL